MTDYIASARAFAVQDPDPETRAELLDLCQRASSGAADALRELGERFGAPLEFGTAGLRGKVEAGLARMNRAVVIQASYGVGRYLLETAAETGVEAGRGVVIGFDGRYSSRQFAEDTAAVLTGLGLPTLLFPDPVSTPLCAFAVRHLRAAAGVMVTASHNPPADNGYKVYRHDGAQIIPPQDQQIAQRISAVPPLMELRRLSPPEAVAQGLRRTIGDEVEQAYLGGLAAGCLHESDGRPLCIVYTAMHGVGHRTLIRAFERAGFSGLVSVPSQTDPDGAFRTVSFPNPEEPGAMDRALALAQEVGAELILANDPDADRLAVAVPDGLGGYRMLSGNEIGWLLADDVLAHTDTGGRPMLVATSIVSSSLLSRMARDRGARYAEALTGFKWIADAARRGEQAGEVFVFGYEEALGYTVGTLVGDKDGIGAALRMAELARYLKSKGTDLATRLDEILVAHGMSHQVQWSVTLPGSDGRARINAALQSLRERPPLEVAGTPVTRIVDLARGTERIVGGGESAVPPPRADVLVLHGGDGTRLTARPSGTEPKVKFYLELVGRVGSRAEVASTRVALDARGQAAKAALLERLALA